MKKDKLITLQFIVGLLLVSTALFINRFVQVADFIKGLIFGVGIGLMILFVLKKRKSKDVIV